jgi:hypothetical protein
LAGSTIEPLDYSYEPPTEREYGGLEKRIGCNKITMWHTIYEVLIITLVVVDYQIILLIKKRIIQIMALLPIIKQTKVNLVKGQIRSSKNLQKIIAAGEGRAQRNLEKVLNRGIVSSKENPEKTGKFRLF